ncbi:MAG: hypothetical protein PVH00_14765 [Gemmatimonadota bacterium]|jgi:hypothetical protein
MKSAFVVLVFFFLVAVSADYFFGDTAWVQRFVPNFASEMIGIIVTLALVQRLLQRQERARRLRGSIGAFRRAGRALSSLAAAWAKLIKGAWAGSSAPPRELGALFSPHVTEQLMYLDPAAPLVTDDAVSCSRWLAAEVAAARKGLEDVLVGYSGLLDPAYGEALDELIDDPFLGLIDEMAGSSEPDARSWRLGINLARGHRDEYFARLLATIELHNRLASEAAEVRSRRGVPRTGSLGMELPRDHDLKAWVVLDNDWWRASPVAGSLRADGRRPDEDALP